MTPKLLNVRDLAEIIGFTVRATKKAIIQEGIPVILIGKKPRFCPLSIQKWIESKRKVTISPTVRRMARVGVITKKGGKP